MFSSPHLRKIPANLLKVIVPKFTDKSHYKLTVYNRIFAVDDNGLLAFVRVRNIEMFKMEQNAFILGVYVPYTVPIFQSIGITKTQNGSLSAV